MSNQNTFLHFPETFDMHVLSNFYQYGRIWHYCTFDAVTNTEINEKYPFRYKISSYVNLNMFYQNAIGYISSYLEITLIYQARI